MKFKEITIDLIYKKENIRDEAESGLDDLAESIDEVDLIHPLVVRTVGDRYELVSGHRRLIALRMQGAYSVPCIIRDDLTDEDVPFFQLIENTQRKQMSASELVRTFDEMKRTHPGLTNGQIAKRLGRSTAWVANQYGAAKQAELMKASGEMDDTDNLTAGQIMGRAQKKRLKEYVVIHDFIKKGNFVVQYRENKIVIACTTDLQRDRLLSLIKDNIDENKI
jgi:ParB/RepB/Spo0J family partition protein